MANLKEVRLRIGSVKSTQQITKAMKMVSAAKLRKAQNAIVQMRPYDRKLNEMLQNILASLEGGVNLKMAEEREVVNPLVVVVTSNKGLCGAFNANVIKQARAVIEEKYRSHYEGGRLHILCIGKKGAEYYKKNFPKAQFISDHVDLVNDLTYENVNVVAQGILDGYTNAELDAIHVAYGRFKNAGTQFAEAVQFAPITPPKKVESDDDDKSRADYIFEPSKEELLEDLIPMILKTQFYRFVLDTHASEHGARMTAMDKASENAEELLKELKITYNKARQEAITNELSEIVGGAAALGG